LSGPDPKFPAFGPVVKVIVVAAPGNAVNSAPKASARVLLEIFVIVFNAHILRYLPKT
jgi:hypothetical protein